MRNPVKLSPSMMCVDFLDLRNTLDLFATAGIESLHIDIMDGHYVPNFTLGPDFCRAIGEYSGISPDIHLMIEDVSRYIPTFAAAGNSIICFHPEVSYHPLRDIQQIQSFSCRAGIAVDPAMPLETVKPLLPHVDMICIMTVNPGYSGQRLIPGSIERIREFREYIDRAGLSAAIEVDGNVSWENIPAMLDAGADILVAGTSSLFDRRRPLPENIAQLRRMSRSQLNPDVACETADA